MVHQEWVGRQQRAVTVVSGPSGYVRQCREQAAQRRLEIVRLLREDASITNIALAAKLAVSRNTIAGDRTTIMNQLIDSTKTETELLRAELVTKLQVLESEVQRHRDKGKLSLSAIDSLLDIHKALIDLTGCRKAVVEKKMVKHSPIQFQTFIGSPAQFAKAQFAKAEFITEPAKLTGEADGN
jgi:hypothetical protein